MKRLLLFSMLGLSASVFAQNVGINTVSPKATLDVNGSFGTTITPVTTGTLTLTDAHATVLASPGTTVALPAASTTSRRIYNIIFFGTTGTAVTITSGSSNIIAQGATGVASFQLTTGSVSFQSDGTNWYADSKTPGTNGNGYIQNQTAAVQSAGYNISGNGSIGGNLIVTGTSTHTGNTSVSGATVLNGNVSIPTASLTMPVALGGTGTRFVTADATGKVAPGVSTTSGITNAMLANPSLTISPGTGLTGGGTVALGGSTTLTLGNVGTAGTYTKVTTDAQGRVTAGTGLSVIDLPTGIPNTNLANSSITVAAGTGLTGGGTVALGGSTTLSLPNTGTAGTYTKVTTDAQGRVTSGGALAASDITAGSGNYIQNGTAQQATSNFNVSGAGTVGTTMQAGTYIFPAPAGDPSPIITARTVPAGQGASNERTELILFHSNDNATNGAGVDMITLRAPGIRLQTYADAGVADINNAAGSNDRLYVSPDGLVGIGTSAPAYTLDVNGNMRAGIHYSTVPNGNVYQVGDDSWLTDINTSNMFGVTGIANSTYGGIRLGNQAYLYSNGAAGMAVNNTAVNSGTALDVNGRVDARNGLRTKKQYYYFTETVHHNLAPEYGEGHRTVVIGNYDLCSLAAVSTLVDEDDGDQSTDQQCNIYPSSLMGGFHGDGVRQVSGPFAVAYDGRPTWSMYIEAQGSTDWADMLCSAICINFDY